MNIRGPGKLLADFINSDFIDNHPVLTVLGIMVAATLLFLWQDPQRWRGLLSGF
jgi:hypothetical protein